DISLRIANLTDKQGKFLYFQLAGIQELRFILQNMKLVVDELRVYSDAREIERQEDLYRQKIRKIATLFLELENNYQQQLSTYLDALNQQVVNDQGLFVLAINKSAFVGLLEGYRERNIQLSQQLSDIYRNLLNQSNSRLDRDASDLLTLMENSKWILLIAALIAVIVCFIFYQFFVKPHITDRILLLANNTNAIADGEYGFEIDTSGSDEVARMARSLDYFRSELMEKETVQIDLADREKMLSTIVDNAMVGLFTVDLKGKILSFNNVCERIFHTTSENAMDISINHFFPESDALFSTHTRRAVSAEGESFTIVNESDLAARCVDGHIFTANLSLSLINLSGRNIYSGFIRDVTTERQSRDRIETLINQLMQSNSDLERFAYSCSHDLQEPVRMVLSFSELLQQHLSDSIDEKTSKYLNFIHLGANNAKDLIRDILEYSRLGKTDTHKKWVNIATLADKVKANIAILLEEKGAVFLCESGDIEIYVVESQMLQLITNLLVNGIKYNKSEVPKVVLTIAEQKQYWQLTIADNGIGIDKRYHERIFDVFNRLVNKNEYSGSGIGLAICKKVVENHQGKIWVESDGCNGSQFHVQLPKSKIAG
ncbi:MAG: ATP-binding protein, partial [Pseudomonadota bacterium]